MREIIVEPTLKEELSELAGQAVLCDSEHRALGIFSPLPDRPKVADLKLESPLSIAELEELRKVKTGKPLEEILARLGL
jgi:hypothetical protein